MNQEKLWVWLDDVRPMPVGFDVHVKFAEDAIELIKTGKVECISLDNDLGIGYAEGKTVAQFIEKEFLQDNMEYVKIRIHTGNSVARDEMAHCARNVERYYREKRNNI